MLRFDHPQGFQEGAMAKPSVRGSGNKYGRAMVEFVGGYRPIDGIFQTTGNAVGIFRRADNNTISTTKQIPEMHYCRRGVITGEIGVEMRKVGNRGKDR